MAFFFLGMLMEHNPMQKPAFFTCGKDVATLFSSMAGGSSGSGGGSGSVVVGMGPEPFWFKLWIRPICSICFHICLKE